MTALINAAMKSPDWDSTAIFLQWDDWGGFYDNVVPPTVDQNGYGLAGAGAGDLAVRQDGATSTTRPSRATPTSSSSRTTSWVARGSTRRPTGDPIHGPTSVRTSRSWATWSTTSTSTRRRGHRCCSRPIRPPTRPPSRPGSAAKGPAWGAPPRHRARKKGRKPTPDGVVGHVSLWTNRHPAESVDTPVRESR